MSISWILQILCFGGLVPALICVVVFRGACFIPKVAPSLWGGVGLAIAFASCGELLDATDYRPTSPVRPLLLLVYAAVVIGLVDPILALKPRIPLRLLASGIAAWMLVPGFMADTFDGVASIASNLSATRQIVGMFAAIFATWSLLGRLAEQQRGATLPFILSAIALTTAIAIECTGYTRLSQLTIILASFLGGCGLVSWWSPDRDWLQTLLPGAVVLLVGGLFTGYFQNSGELTNYAFLPLLVAPILIGLVGSGRLWTQRIIAAACCAASLVMAVS